MGQRRVAHRTGRPVSVLWGFDNNDLVAFGGVLLVTYTAAERSIENLILRIVCIALVMVVTWLVWFPLKDKAIPKFMNHLLGWHAAPDVYQVRGTTRTPVPLIVDFPSKTQALTNPPDAGLPSKARRKRLVAARATALEVNP